MSPPSEILPLAKAAEAAGWDAVAVPDSVFFPEQVSAEYPYTPDGSRFWDGEVPFVDPFVSVPAMAAVTERLAFYTNVYKVVLREPLLVAKMLGSLAAMFEGRVAIGLGLSWIPEEFRWLGQEMKTRGKRLDETIDILRATLQPGFTEYHGKQYDFDRLMMSPAPALPVPIYVGGHSDAAIDRAARVGDGWIGAQVGPPEIDELVGKLRTRLAAHDRADDAFEIKLTPLVLATEEAMAGIAAQGVTDVITIPWLYHGSGPHSLEQKVESVHRFAEEVIAPLSD
jgi:probable F420-dependent oxidoreductase